MLKLIYFLIWSSIQFRYWSTLCTKRVFYIFLNWKCFEPRGLPYRLRENRVFHRASARRTQFQPKKCMGSLLLSIVPSMGLLYLSITDTFMCCSRKTICYLPWSPMQPSRPATLPANNWLEFKDILTEP